MGIAGLLPLLKSVTDHVHISAYANQTVAIDAYCWLYRGAIAHAAALCQDPNASDSYITFVLGRLQLLLDAGVKPFLVFDGGPLPAKNAQERMRAERRQRSLQSAQRLDGSGFKAAADRHYRQALNITPSMAKRTIHAVQAKYGDRVRFVVAPYEADAQLTWLVNNGHASAALTEDSDLLVFGCERVLFKLDTTGHVDQIRLQMLGACQQVNLARWSLAEFQLMCVLSGCDYATSLDGLGLRTAHKFVALNKTPARVIQRLRLHGKFKIPDDYASSVLAALFTFQHQRVYDIVRQRLVPLHQVSDRNDLGALLRDDFFGPDLEHDTAIGIAEGRLDPVTLEPFLDSRSAEMLHNQQQTQSGNRAFQSYFVRPERITLSRKVIHCSLLLERLQ